MDHFSAVALMRSNLEGLDSVIRWELRGSNPKMLDWDRMRAEKRPFYGRSFRLRGIWSGIARLAGCAIICHGGRQEFEAFGRDCNLDEFQLCVRRCIAAGKLPAAQLGAYIARLEAAPFPRSLAAVRARREGRDRIAHLVAEHQPSFRIWEPGPPEVKLKAEANGAWLGGIFEGGQN